MMAAPLFANTRPYTRWWWFSGPIDAAVTRHQLDWVAANGCGMPMMLAFAPGASLLVTVTADGAVHVRST